MTLRKAGLLVGIDNYRNSPLNGCANDAKAMHDLLTTNADGSPNFACRLLVAPLGASAPIVTRSHLRAQLEQVLSKQVDMALFYFSGHGMITPRGGILVTEDASTNDEGVTMGEVLEAANRSEIPQIAIIVDACYSGRLGGGPSVKDDHILLREGVSILAASSANETALERGGRGVFTTLICGALDGGASDILGEVTSASAYAYAEQALGPLDQRPMFKANVARLSVYWLSVNMTIGG